VLSFVNESSVTAIAHIGIPMSRSTNEAAALKQPPAKTGVAIAIMRGSGWPVFESLQQTIGKAIAKTTIKLSKATTPPGPVSFPLEESGLRGFSTYPSSANMPKPIQFLIEGPSTIVITDLPQRGEGLEAR
jgi:hypothetical protein